MGDTNKGDSRLEEYKARLSRGFQGEEDLEGASTPQKDLVAAVFIALFSVVAMMMAWGMPNPGNVYTAPGLLPLITGGSLLLMAIGIGVRAVREGGARQMGSILSVPTGAGGDRLRAGVLIALLVALVTLVDVVSFDLSLSVAGFELRITSFECMTIPVLTVILRLFWRAPVWRCLLVAAVTVLALAAAFRYGFTIPLPGTD